MPEKRFIHYSLAVILIVVSATTVVMWFEKAARSQISLLEQHWKNDNTIAAEQTHMFNLIHKSYGYGGFTHNFKNLLLHRDSSRNAVIDKNITDIYGALDKYQGISRSKTEYDAINTFRETVDLYAKKYLLAKQLFAQGLNTNSIEQQVHFDDIEALQALDKLAQATYNKNPNIEQLLDQEIANALEFFNWSWILIPLFVITGSIIIFILLHLIKNTRALQEAKNYVDDIIQASPDALIVINQQGEILRTNIVAQQLFGYASEEFSRLRIEDLIPERFRNKHVAYRQQAFVSTNPRAMEKSTELVGLSKDHREIPVEISLGYTRRENEIQVVAAIRDISSRKLIETRLRLTSKVFEEASEGILILDHETNIVDMNKAFCRQMGYQRQELIGQSPTMFRSGHHDEDFYTGLWENTVKYGHWKGEIWDRHKDGQFIPNLLTISAVADESGVISHYIAIYADITLLKEKEQHLEQLAHFDQLTGLPNRMLCHDRLRASMHRSRRTKSSCAILYIDLDGFKQINDQLGHEIGDEVLINVGQRLLQTIREDDTAARMGGDEFVVILNEIENFDKAKELIQRILDAISFPVKSEQGELPISASIGVALYPEHGDTIEGLISSADQAMYYCKHHGKKSYHCFSEHMGKNS